MKRVVCWNPCAGAILCLFAFALALAFECVEGRRMDCESSFFMMLLLPGMMYPISLFLTWVIDQRAAWTVGDLIGRLLMTALCPLVSWVEMAVFCVAVSAIYLLLQAPRAELVASPQAISCVVWLLLTQ